MSKMSIDNEANHQTSSSNTQTQRPVPLDPARNLSFDLDNVDMPVERSLDQKLAETRQKLSLDPDEMPKWHPVTILSHPSQLPRVNPSSLPKTSLHNLQLYSIKRVDKRSVSASTTPLNMSNLPTPSTVVTPKIHEATPIPRNLNSSSSPTTTRQTAGKASEELASRNPYGDMDPFASNSPEPRKAVNPMPRHPAERQLSPSQPSGYGAVRRYQSAPRSRLNQEITRQDRDMSSYSDDYEPQSFSRSSPAATFTKKSSNSLPSRTPQEARYEGRKLSNLFSNPPETQKSTRSPGLAKMVKEMTDEPDIFERSIKPSFVHQMLRTKGSFTRLPSEAHASGQAKNNISQHASFGFETPAAQAFSAFAYDDAPYGEPVHIQGTQTREAGAGRNILQTPTKVATYPSPNRFIPAVGQMSPFNVQMPNQNPFDVDQSLVPPPLRLHVKDRGSGSDHKETRLTSVDTSRDSDSHYRTTSTDASVDATSHRDAESDSFFTADAGIERNAGKRSNLFSKLSRSRDSKPVSSDKAKPRKLTKIEKLQLKAEKKEQAARALEEADKLALAAMTPNEREAVLFERNRVAVQREVLQNVKKEREARNQAEMGANTRVLKDALRFDEATGQEIPCQTVKRVKAPLVKRLLGAAAHAYGGSGA